jgi:Uma2 family endonuclease
MASAPRPRYTPEEYLAMESAAEYKSEYIDGEIYAMSGGSEAHILITDNIGAELRSQFKGRPCRAYTSEMRVRVSPKRMYTYPDVVAVCEPRQFTDEHRDTLLNPNVIFEVLSPSTEKYDRTFKFDRYTQLESLTDYVLVAQDSVRVEHFVRDGERWLFSVITDLNASIHLASIDCTLALAEIYDNVEFPDPPPPPPGHEHARLI